MKDHLLRDIDEGFGDGELLFNPRRPLHTPCTPAKAGVQIKDTGSTG